MKRTLFLYALLVAACEDGEAPAQPGSALRPVDRLSVEPIKPSDAGVAKPRDKSDKKKHDDKPTTAAEREEIERREQQQLIELQRQEHDWQNNTNPSGVP